ncbi:TPA: helix-turn-helix transcriptional regulator [Salmonella enterica]|uniref:Helix-turn-helix transcriptional regulator n=1 Tax=Salmonella enterica TaxID=28901 RepID=A0A761KWW6_SALER|nr:helix-turn-helix transcriptional regulator [Salmonella enterica]HDJ1975110.1 helix-turn-helix transcriptional regulator [Salmonella enterica subsp. enterica]HAG5569662.1 helix-turn-helix transcriptional regulator [Salmonella enterica]HAK0561849.1 helix-turn-helix transcriptional regulator [Salmonella enterica]HAK0611916.1 helix-turn-helix transcriptional regulator [Salmonella enterica]
MNHDVTRKESVSIKGDDFSFPLIQKESIKQRLKALMKGRSKSAVAKAWGLPFSTLNNYFEKDAVPSLQVASQIAKAEGVSIDWLVFGKSKDSIPAPDEQTCMRLTNSHDVVLQRLIAILSALDIDDAEALSKLLAINGALYLSRLLNSDNQSLLRLEGRKRVAALMLEDMSDERVREILAEIENDKPAADVVNVKAG